MLSLLLTSDGDDGEIRQKLGQQDIIRKVSVADTRPVEISFLFSLVFFKIDREEREDYL